MIRSRGGARHNAPRVAVAAGLATCAVAVLSCGSGSKDSSPQVSKGDIERRLQALVAKETDGSKIKGLTCVQRGEREYRCIGDFYASRRYAKASMGSIDTSNFGSRDWKVIQEQNSGPVTYDVSVDPKDGSFIAQPVN